MVIIEDYCILLLCDTIIQIIGWIIGIIVVQISDGLFAIIVASFIFGLFGLFVLDYLDESFYNGLYELFRLLLIIPNYWFQTGLF